MPTIPVTGRVAIAALLVFAAAACGGQAASLAATPAPSPVPRPAVATPAVATGTPDTTASPAATPSSTAIASPSAPIGTLAGDGWIVWQTSAGLTVARLDGSARRQPFAERAGQADWSPDGRRLAYRIDQPDGTSDLFVVDRDGANVRLLVDGVAPGEIAQEPAWSPDGTRIAYWTSGDDLPQVIRVADAETGKTLLTVPAPDLVGPITPRWSPDGRHLAVHGEIVEQTATGYATVDGRIGIIDLQAKRPEITFITEPGLKAMYPDWSPDGSRLVFVAGSLYAPGHIAPILGSDDPTDLYTILPDGTDLVRLTQRERGQPRLVAPTWTQADPPLLVTLVKGPRSFALGALDADGADLVELVDSDGMAFEGLRPRVWVAP